MRMESPLNQRLRWSPPDVVYTPIDVTSRVYAGTIDKCAVLASPVAYQEVAVLCDHAGVHSGRASHEYPLGDLGADDNLVVAAE